jgi:hypothetical protein
MKETSNILNLRRILEEDEAAQRAYKVYKKEEWSCPGDCDSLTIVIFRSKWAKLIVVVRRLTSIKVFV